MQYIKDVHAQPYDENDYAIYCLHNEKPPAVAAITETQIAIIPDRKTVLCELNSQVNNICDVVYEKICEGYWYGMYVDFRVIIKRENGYINGTKLCTDNDKMIKNWLRNASTKVLLDKFKAMNPGVQDQILVKGGKIVDVRGTYIHPLLIPSLVSWVSPEYTLHINNVINAYNIAMTNVPLPAILPSDNNNDDVSSISSDDDFKPPERTLMTIFNKNLFMAPLPECGKPIKTNHDEFPMIMVGYTGDKAKQRHVKRIKKLYGNASVVVSDYILKPDMKSFKKFLKSKKVHSVGMHIDSVSKQILDLY